MNITDMTPSQFKAAYRTKVAEEVGGHRVCDMLLAEFGLKNDAAIAKHLRLPPSMVSKIRSGAVVLSPMVIIRIHEFTELPVAQIKALAGIPRFDVQK